jgi:serine kinase of HPr protein (carbohydrate metabolism regulator)
MSKASLSSETLHVSCVARNGAAILIGGKSGAGKSDLALRLIGRGASLVSDDYTLVRRVAGRLLATAPPNIAGKIEVRGLGVIDMPFVEDVPVCLYVDLDREQERLPEPIEPVAIAGVKVPVVGISALEASAPVKVEVALEHFGLKRK